MTTRDRTILVVICVVAALGAAWLLVLGPKRSQAASLGTQISSIQGQLQAIRTQVAEDESARHAFAANYSELARLGEAVPADDDVPSLLYELQSASSASRVDFLGLQLTQGSSGASSPSSSTAKLPPGVLVGPAGFPMEPFNFTFQGNFFHLSNFFQRLDKFVVATDNRVSVSGRLITLNSINLAAGSQGFPQITATISATTYLVPASEGLLDGATAAGPASGAAGSASGTSSSGASTAAVVTPPVR